MATRIATISTLICTALLAACSGSDRFTWGGE
jgi:hypothetical protein